MFPLDDIRKVTSRLAGTTLRVSATVYDWEFLEEKTNTASTLIIESGAFIKFLGGTVRTFKPNQPFNVYVSISLFQKQFGLKFLFTSFE